MNLRRIKKYFSSALVITELELRKIKNDQTQIWLRTVQPALWLVIYGVTMNSVGIMNKYIPSNMTYLQYMTPGILAQSVLFVAIFYGINVVWERDLGILNKLLSTPAPRSSIALGKALSAGARGIFQSVAVMILALIMRINIILNVGSVLGVFGIIILLGMCFSCVSMSLAPIFKTRERMMGIGQVITMPLFFASNAIYPLSIMPAWLKPVAIINPLSYVIDAVRIIFAPGFVSLHPLGIDLMAVAIATLVFLVLASLSFRKIIT